MPEPSKTQRQPLSFTATDWKDDKAGGTPITAAQLNRVEKGIADAVKGVNDANKRVLTFLVQSDGEHATQDINGAAITAPCQIYSIDEKKTWVDDGTGARIAPFATAEEMKTVRDSLSRTKFGDGVEGVEFAFNEGDRRQPQIHFAGMPLHIWFDPKRGIGLWDEELKKSYVCHFDEK